MIDSKSLIHESATIAANVKIGAYAVVDKNVTIGEGTIIKEYAVIRENTTIGKNNHIYQFATVGEQPQDLKFSDEHSTCTIGDNNIIREYSSIHRGTKDGISDTIIGNNNLLMAYTHIAHDCIVGDKCILSNAASLAGHVKLESHISLGGFTLVHQFCHIGKYAFSGLGTVISQDVTPYTLIAGNHARAYKINSEGLKRKNFDDITIRNLERCFKIFIKSTKTLEERLALFKGLNITCNHSDRFVNFILNSKRGITR